MAPAAGWTPTPDRPPPLGIYSGLPLIRCPECGMDEDVVEEYIPRIGGATAGILWEDAVLRRGGGGGCSFFKTQEEYEALLRDRGLLGPAATPEQGQGRGCYLTPVPSGFLVPEPVGYPGMFAAAEDLKQEMVALKLAIAELTADIEQDLKDLKGKLGARDKVWKVMKTDSFIRWSKSIVKGFSAFGFGVLLGMVSHHVCQVTRA